MVSACNDTSNIVQLSDSDLEISCRLRDAFELIVSIEDDDPKVSDSVVESSCRRETILFAQKYEIRYQAVSTQLGHSLSSRRRGIFPHSGTDGRMDPMRTTHWGTRTSTPRLGLMGLRFIPYNAGLATLDAKYYGLVGKDGHQIRLGNLSSWDKTGRR
jgi:hypothetical protein